MAVSTHLDRLRDYQDQFRRTITDVDSATPVVSCGDWTVRELVEHLADVHTWAAHRAGGPRVRPADLPDLADFYAAAATVLVDALSALDPDEPCWTLLDDDVPTQIPRIGTRRFWHRRQALETLVHLWDLRTAGGLELECSAAEWLDCADEVVTVMQPRQLRLGRISPPSTRVVLAPDGGTELLLDGAPAGAPEVRVHGTAEQLALLLWGRLDAESLVVTGDRTALATALAGIVP